MQCLHLSQDHDEEIQQDYVRAARIARPEEEWYRQALLHDPGKLKLNRRRFLAAEADTPAAAHDLARICAHFLGAAPDLVAGRSPSVD